MVIILKNEIFKDKILNYKNDEYTIYFNNRLIQCNVFDEENCTAMMWAVHHEWKCGVQFVFNCYRYWATLVIRAGDGTGHFLHSK